MTNEEAKAWCLKYNRHYCCRENPCNGQGSAMHEETIYTDSYSDYSASYKCLVCGHEWSEELPE